MLGVWTTLEVLNFFPCQCQKPFLIVYAIEYPSIFSALLEVDTYDDEISPMN